MPSTNKTYQGSFSAIKILVVFAAILQCAHGQQINVGLGQLFESDDVFNSHFISEHGIREIEGSFTLKKSNLPPTETGQRVTYSFDEVGRLIKIKTWYANGLRANENAVTYFTYGPHGLKSKKIETLKTSTLTYYTYDEKGDLSSETTIKKTPYFTDEKTTYYSYYVYDEQHVNVISENDEHRKVSEETRNFQDNGLPLEISRKFEIGNMRSHKGFVYNPHNQLSHLVYTIKKMGDVKTMHYSYTWQDDGHPREERVLLNNKPLARREFLYKNGLLVAQLIKDELSQNIEIIEYQYRLF